MLSHVQWFHWTPLILILRTHGFSAITQHSAQMLPTSQPRHGGGPNWWCFVIQSEKSVFAKGNTCKNGQQRFWFIESMIHISYTVIFWDIIYRELKAFTFMILYDTVSFCMSKYYIYVIASSTSTWKALLMVQLTVANFFGRFLFRPFF